MAARRLTLRLLGLALATIAAAGCGGQADIEGAGWTITAADVARLVEFIEDTHELGFLSPVEVVVYDDMPAPTKWEPIGLADWQLLQALGIVDQQADRHVANQARRDARIGGCCREQGGYAIGIEVDPNRLFTESLIVHELTHALHLQHYGSWDSSLSGSERLSPRTAMHEGAANHMAFAYVATASDADRVGFNAAVAAKARREAETMGDAFDFLWWGYDSGKLFIDELVAERGIGVIGDLRTSLPTTTEQVLFPQAYLARDVALTVAPVPTPPGSPATTQGTLGVAAIILAMQDTVGVADARSMVESWAGDSYVAYPQDGVSCLNAVIEMDTDAAANRLAAALESSLVEVHRRVSAVATATTIHLATC